MQVLREAGGSSGGGGGQGGYPSRGEVLELIEVSKLLPWVSPESDACVRACVRVFYLS